MIRLTTPITDEERLALRSGDEVLISGTIYTARDAAHQKMLEAIKKTGKAPFAFPGEIVYYVGPTPAKPAQVIGSCGPTSSYRMDPYSIQLMPQGLKLMIGKGDRSEAFKSALKATQSVYLIAIGGIGALLAKRVLKAEVIAYPELQSEAIHKLEVRDFPCIVAYDAVGNDVFIK